MLVENRRMLLWIVVVTILVAGLYYYYWKQPSEEEGRHKKKSNFPWKKMLFLLAVMIIVILVQVDFSPAAQVQKRKRQAALLPEPGPAEALPEPEEAFPAFTTPEPDMWWDTGETEEDLWYCVRPYFKHASKKGECKQGGKAFRGFEHVATATKEQCIEQCEPLNRNYSNLHSHDGGNWKLDDRCGYEVKKGNISRREGKAFDMYRRNRSDNMHITCFDPPSGPCHATHNRFRCHYGHDRKKRKAPRAWWDKDRRCYKNTLRKLEKYYNTWKKKKC